LLPIRAGRRRAGLPDSWEIVEQWAKEEPPFFTKFTPAKKDDSEKAINEKQKSNKFWREFPQRKLPEKPTTKVRIKTLEKLVSKHQDGWTSEEKTKAKMAISNLKYGAPANQQEKLPATKQKNAPSAYENADEFTEVLRGWVEGGVVAGPFTSPPVNEFRANCLMAVVKKNKVRPVVNLSSPKKPQFQQQCRQAGSHESKNVVGGSCGTGDSVRRTRRKANENGYEGCLQAGTCESRGLQAPGLRVAGPPVH
jgi:hypothetical protein